MKKISFSDVRPYTPAAGEHTNMVALKLHGKEETGLDSYWMGLSHFLPTGGAGVDDSPFEKVYFVLEGEITIIDVENNKEIRLGKWDSIAIGRGESRRIRNETNNPVSMLVVYSTK
ncbi:MAG: cupin domain-containing protein [bacterium]|nr:cupin domain-containing protein [bacterium]